MKSTTRTFKLLTGAVFATVAMVLLAACGSDPTSTPRPTPTDTSTELEALRTFAASGVVDERVVTKILEDNPRRLYGV